MGDQKDSEQVKKKTQPNPYIIKNDKKEASGEK